MHNNLTTRTLDILHRIGSMSNWYIAGAGALLVFAAGTGTGMWIGGSHSNMKIPMQQTTDVSSGEGPAAYLTVQPLAGTPRTLTVYVAGSDTEAAALQHELTRLSSDSSVVPVPASQQFTVYLLGSQADADALRRESVWLANTLDAAPPGNVDVVPAGTVQERAEARLYLKNLILDLGRENVRVTDLRLH